MQKRKLIFLLLLLLCWQLPAQDALNAVGGNTLWGTKSGEEFMNHLLQDIEAAQNTIEIEYYWFDTDISGKRMKKALMAKAREGVKVRLIMDNLITPFAPESFYDEMKQAGVEIHYVHPFEKMNPFQAVGSIFGPRDHRKIVVIDGSISYTGGINFYDKAVYEWKDTQVRVEGPAATQLWEFFAQSWQKLAGEYLDPSAYPVPAGEVLAEAFATSGNNQLDSTYIALLNNAQQYFYLQTPYFAPQKELVEAFKEAVGRGVDVRIIVPHKSDWGFMNELTREYSVELKQAGVDIYVYMGLYDHTKIFVTDDNLACCSTVNMDYRSLRTNWEDGFYFHDSQSILYFKDLFLGIAGRSERMGADAQPSKGVRKVYRNFLKKLSPLF